jgi:hypothetical protein
MTAPVAAFPQLTPAASRGPRPATATVAVWLQGAAVLLSLLMIMVVWSAHVRWVDLINQVSRSVPGVDPAAVAAERESDLAVTIVATVLLGLAVLWFAGTLVPMWRGSNGARIVSLVGSGLVGLGGFVLTCAGFGLGLLFAGLFMSVPMEPMPDGSDPLAAEDFGSGDPFSDRLFELSASRAHWTDVVGPILLLLLVLLLIAVFVLLLVRPSNRWYSPRRLPAYGPYAAPAYGSYPYPIHPYQAYPNLPAGYPAPHLAPPVVGPVQAAAAPADPPAADDVPFK